MLIELINSTGAKDARELANGDYDIIFSDSTYRKATAEEVTLARRQKLIRAVYEKCKALNDEQSSWYPIEEIATFPLLQQEIAAYNADNNAIGAMMQKVIGRGRHTAATLAAVISGKMAIEAQNLQARDDHVAAILALTTAQQITDYSINTGWTDLV